MLSLAQSRKSFRKANASKLKKSKLRPAPARSKRGSVGINSPSFWQFHCPVLTTRTTTKKCSGWLRKQRPLTSKGGTTTCNDILNSSKCCQGSLDIQRFDSYSENYARRSAR